MNPFSYIILQMIVTKYSLRKTYKERDSSTI